MLDRADAKDVEADDPVFHIDSHHHPVICCLLEVAGLVLEEHFQVVTLRIEPDVDVLGLCFYGQSCVLNDR